MGITKALLISHSTESWNLSFTWAIERYMAGGEGSLQVVIAATREDALCHLKIDPKIICVFFYSFGWNEDPLDMIQAVRTAGYRGALLLIDSSSHALNRLAQRFPLSQIVDGVFGILEAKDELIHQAVQESLLRAEERCLGKLERKAIWLSKPIVTGKDAQGFRIIDGNLTGKVYNQ